MGAPVDIIMTLPDGERLHLPGTVAYLGTGAGGDVGVRFDELPGLHAAADSRATSTSWPPGARPRSGRRSKSIPPGVLIKKKT